MGEVEERKVNAMSTKEGVMIMNGWDSAQSKGMKGWAEKAESPFLRSLLCVMLVARGKECLVGAISLREALSAVVNLPLRL